MRVRIPLRSARPSSVVEAAGQLARAEGEDQEHRGGRGPPQQRAGQLDRRRVGPVEVVEDDGGRPGGERLEQRAHRAVRAVALALQGLSPVAPERRQGGEHAGELGEHVVAEALEPAWLQALDVRVDRVDEHAEGQVALELRGRAGQDEMALVVGAPRQLGEQVGLADPGRADDGQRPAVAVRGARQRRVHRLQLLQAAHERA